jgi:hypothetical protein
MNDKQNQGVGAPAEMDDAAAPATVKMRQMCFRMPVDLYEEIKRHAVLDDRSVTWEIVKMLKAAVALELQGRPKGMEVEP